MLGAAPRMHSAYHLAEQTVEVPGSTSATETVFGLAESLAVTLRRRETLETRVAVLLGPTLSRRS
ncbi:hypothetical protein M2283_010272 [Streptomyces pseudovenezuelae]|uniref:Uncharacterized protein n=1 Tax=Streptomyces pseudovenezuelae TaxID=67350 RepID=A0ABT6M2Z4_9ACTN|nr:hypothetical protein [Streptomyces pseudovenezuelae]